MALRAAQRTLYVAAFAAICNIIIPTAAAQERTASAPVARAVRIDPEKAPVVDGFLNDPVWSAIEPIQGLRQREPDEYRDPTEKTIIRIAQDGANLYFAIECYDSDAGGIRATQMRRDADLDPDDRIEIVLDTLHDRRNAYFFAIGAGGAIQDALISSNGRIINSSWDGIWSGAARVGENGWFAEIKIPIRTLATQDHITTWGFNIARTIRRKREEDAFASPAQDISFERVSAAGDLEGMRNLAQGIGLDVVPYAKTTISRNDITKNNDWLGAAGGEAYFRLTPGITATLTANTDFAETEVDDRQVNLTRFPLFFPEKRRFFLEDAGVFAFDTGGSGDSPDLVPFFSRRIGLNNNGGRIPLDAGARISGYAGPWSVGLLGVETGQTRTTPSDELVAARARYNINDRSAIGGILTSGNPAGGSSNDVLGLDYRYSTGDFAGGKNLDITAFALKSTTPGLAGNDGAFGGEIRYPNDLWQWRLRAREIGDHFSPALGFVERTGIRELDGEIFYRPRPHNDVRQFSFGFQPGIITDLSGQVQTLTMQESARAVMDSGDEAKVYIKSVFDRVLSPFDIVPGLTVAADSYNYTRYGFSAETAGKRPWVLAFGTEFGNFNDGARTDITAQAEWRPSGVFHASLESQTVYLRLLGGDADVQVGRARTEVNFSTEVSWQTLVQFDNVSKDAGINSRLRWIMKPGSDLFLVVDHGWQELPSRAIVPQSTDVTIKIAWTLRF